MEMLVFSMIIVFLIFVELGEYSPGGVENPPGGVENPPGGHKRDSKMCWDHLLTSTG